MSSRMEYSPTELGTRSEGYPQSFTFVSVLTLRNAFPQYYDSVPVVQAAVPTGVLSELGEATLEGIDQGVAEIESGDSVGPMEHREFLEYLVRIGEE